MFGDERVIFPAFPFEKAKELQGGIINICMRIVVNGKRVELSTGRECGVDNPGEPGLTGSKYGLL